MGILNPWSLYLGAFLNVCFVFVVVENILGQSSVKDKHACYSIPHNYFRASDKAVTHSRVQMGNVPSSLQHLPCKSRRRIREPAFPSSSWADHEGCQQKPWHQEKPGVGHTVTVLTCTGPAHGSCRHHLCLWGLLVSNLIKSPGDLFQSLSPLKTNYFLNEDFSL